ncbi:MAG: hypothetical protein ACOX37_01835 [Bacillota bacterium]
MPLQLGFGVLRLRGDVVIGPYIFNVICGIEVGADAHISPRPKRMTQIPTTVF